MKWLFAVLGSLLCLAPVRGEEEWELVFPENYPSKEDLVLCSIGAKVREDQPNVYLIGSHSGYAILGVDDVSSEAGVDWTLVKLPVSFDICAVDVLNGQWIIGGSDGQVAIHNQPNPDSTAINDLTQNWILHQLDSNVDVIDFACLGDTILALHAAEERQVTLSLGALDIVSDVLVRDLRISQDGGKSWSLLDDYTATYGIEVFNGQFYIMNRGELITARPDTSPNGISFTTVWNLEKFKAKAGLYLLDQMVDPFGNATNNGNRLYIKGHFNYSSDISAPRFSSKADYDFYLSTIDGNEWFDHGSRFTRSDSTGLYHGFWNPLDLPEENRLSGFADWPEVISDGAQIAGNYSLGSSTLYHYNGSVTQEIFAGTSMDDMFLNSGTIAQWNGLAFGYKASYHSGSITKPGIYTLDHNGVIHSIDSVPEITELKQIVSAKGGYFLSVKTEGTPSDRLLYTKNFQNWTELPPTPGHPISQNIILGTGSGLYYSREAILYEWNTTEETWNPLFSYKGYANKLAFHEPSDSWFQIEFFRDELRLMRLSDTGEFDIVGKATPASNGYDYNLVSPDGVKLISFHQRRKLYRDGSCELFLFETDGSAIPVDLSALFPENRRKYINAIHYVNGWYYILGVTTIRTKDFRVFESVQMPTNEPLVHIAGFDGYLYAFSPKAVYRTSLETGYLGSIEHKLGWYHADWLGWFQIIDEELGDIDHLLLGKCWVKPVNDQQYWLRTSTLGWIYIYKDWSPWFWRMADGHWYWLDHDSWPGRAWDDDDQKWEELHLHESGQSADKPLP